MNKVEWVCVDLETTGLEPDAIILEIGVVLADREFQPLASRSTVVRPPHKIDWEALDPYVTKMHEKNGLRKQIDNGEGMSLINAQADMIDFLLSHNAEGMPMFGSTIYMDRTWLRHSMPGFDSVFHYRNVDISSIKELCRRLNPTLFSKLPSADDSAHRVIADCKASLAQGKFYADNFFFVED